MATPAERAAYERALRDVSARYARLEDTTIRQMMASLQELRRNIAADLLSIPGDRFEAYHLTELQRAVDRRLAELSAQLDSVVKEALRGSFAEGELGVIDPLLAVGVQGVFHTISIAKLNAVMDFSADLIQAIIEPMRKDINTQIRLAVLGGKSPFKAMQEITRILGVKATDLRWGRLKRPEVVKGVAARAEAILRTEMTRVHNLAHHGQQQQVAQQVDVKKQWMATGDDRTRLSHLLAHGQIRKVDEPFVVGASRLMFPGDPAAPPEETVNCRCRLLTIHPDIGPIAVPEDDRIRAERERRREKK